MMSGLPSPVTSASAGALRNASPCSGCVYCARLAPLSGFQASTAERTRIPLPGVSTTPVTTSVVAFRGVPLDKAVDGRAAHRFFAELGVLDGDDHVGVSVAVDVDERRRGRDLVVAGVDAFLRCARAGFGKRAGRVGGYRPSGHE